MTCRSAVLVALALGLTTAPYPAMASPVVVPAPTPGRVSPVQAAYRGMTPAERVGQLFMVGVKSSGPSEAKLARLRRLKVGNVILDGNSASGQTSVGLVTARIAAGLQRSGAAPFIATDQEGGQVQRLTGPGFTPLPSALEQGGWTTTKLTRESAAWGRQLEAAGISLNLAPVADTVPAPHARRNQPIGRYDREYGHTPAVVGPHVAAVVAGESRHLAVALKHFPGLGRATGNTDLERHVTDPTTRTDGYLAPFQDGIDARAPFVMVSLARYPNIDPDRPACFSATVMKTMLRHDLGFTGVVISDSFHAVAVRNVPRDKAAVRFFRAGGTMLLDTASSAASIRQMRQAVLVRAKSHPAFAATIKADVLRVLRAKSDAGLLATVQP